MSGASSMIDSDSKKFHYLPTLPIVPPGNQTLHIMLKSKAKSLAQFRYPSVFAVATLGMAWYDAAATPRFSSSALLFRGNMSEATSKDAPLQVLVGKWESEKATDCVSAFP